MEDKTILFISGDGHSGTTLLDILLGFQTKAFSTGELINLPQKGIKNKEYCSCGIPVPDCEVWSNIIDEWERRRTLDLDEYIEIQKELISIKRIILSYKKLKNPSEKILDFLNDIHLLYDLIFKITNSDIIIDSSKAPSKILILRKLGFNIRVIHLIRRFGDVLNSNKKKAKKDLKAGIEHDIHPRNTLFILTNWTVMNLLTMICSRGMHYQKVLYEEIVGDPINNLSKLVDNDLEFTDKLKNRGPFYPKHLVAGNKIRMKNHIYIAEKPMDTSYHRLNKADKLLARCIDYFYQF